MKMQESVNMGVFGLFFSRTKTNFWIFVSSVLLLLFLEATAVHRERYIPPSMYNRQTQRGTWRSRQSQYPQQISSQRLQRFQQIASQRRNVNRMPPFRNTQRSLQQRGQSRGSRPIIGQIPPYRNGARTSLSRQNAVQYRLDNVGYPTNWRSTQYNNNNAGRNTVTNRGYNVDVDSVSNRQQRVQINNLDNNSIKVLENNPVQNRPQEPIVYNPTVRVSSSNSINGAKNTSPRVAVRTKDIKGKTDNRNVVSKAKPLPANNKPLVLSKASLSESLKSTSNVPKPAIKTIPISATNTGNKKNGNLIKSDIPVPIREHSVVIPAPIKPVKLQKTKTNVSTADSVRRSPNLAKKPVLLLVRKQDGTVSNTLYKLRRTASDGNNKPVLSPVVANIPKILSSLSRIRTNGTSIVRVVRTGSVLNNSSPSISKTAGKFLNRLLPPRVSPGVQSIGKVKALLPNVINMPLVNSMLSNMNLQNRNVQASTSLKNQFPAMGSMNNNAANLQALVSAMGARLPGGGMRSMTPFAQQPMNLMSMAGSWDGGSANVPLVFQRMGITHGSQLSPSMQERLFGDTIDPPDPTPTAGSSGTTQTATGAEVEAEDLPSSPKPKSKRMQKKMPKGKRRRVHQRRKTKLGKIATTLATTPTLNNKPSTTTPAPKDIAVSLAKKLISLMSKGDPTANGILKSLNIDVPTIKAKPTTKSTPRRSNEQKSNILSKPVDKTPNNINDHLVEKSITLLNPPQKKTDTIGHSQMITTVHPASKKPKTHSSITLPARPITAPKKALNTGEKISLSSFLSSNDLGGLKIEKIIPELPQPSHKIKPLMETPTSPPVLLQSLAVQSTTDEKAKHTIPSPVTTIAPQTSEVTTLLPTQGLGSQKNPPAVQKPVKPSVDILFMPKVLPIDKMISSTLLATKTPSASALGKPSGEIGGLNIGSGDKNESSVDVLLSLLSQLNSSNNPATNRTLANKEITVYPGLLPSTTQPPTSRQTTAHASLPPPTKSAILPQRQRCSPSSPGFQCRGVDFFATLESMGKWCVDTCREKGCVRSVCECNCNGTTRPAFRNNKWRQGRRQQNNQNGRRWNRRRNGRFRGRGWQQGRRGWQRPTTTTEEPPEIEDDEVVQTTTEAMTTTTAYDFTFGFYSDDSFQTTPMTGFDENARPPPNWRGTQWELPPAPIRPQNRKKNEDNATQNPNSWNQEANGWSGGPWEQRSNDRWNQPARNRWNNQRRFRGGSRDTWREPIGNSRGGHRGSWQNSQQMHDRRSGDHWRRDMVGNRQSVDGGFRLRNTWRASKNGGEEQEGQEQ